MKILLKLPSRGRPQKLLQVLEKYVGFAKHPEKIQFMINIDLDDPTFSKEVEEKILFLHPNIRVFKGYSRSKIDACNRDMQDAEFDIVVLASDDMIPSASWDDVVRKRMEQNFPDTDGALFFCDGYRKNLNTLSILGRKMYERFNYIYHPAYKSFFCDEEWTIVASSMNKLARCDDMIIRHEHTMNNSKVENDQTYQKNERFWNSDKVVFEIRKQMGFPLDCPMYTSGEKIQYHCTFNLDDRYALRPYTDAKEGESVFLKMSDIPKFLADPPPEKVILVIHNSDETFTEAHKNLLDPFAIKIYAANCSASANQIPLGLRDDQYTTHQLFLGIATVEKTVVCFVNFLLDTNYSARKEALDTLSKNKWMTFRAYPFNLRKSLCHDDQNVVSERIETYNYFARSKFVICPAGTGQDTHRVWEALMFKCLPIVKSSFLDPLYKKYGVIIVQDWSEVTQEACEAWWKNPPEKTHVFE